MQTFRKLRERNCYYVDKTPYLQRLLDEGTHYFLSRPRGFGKSLPLDTLKELFEGNGELFAGLYIHDRHDWSERHPVVRLRFGGGSFAGPDALEANVMEQLAGRRTTPGSSIRLPDGSRPLRVSAGSPAPVDRPAGRGVLVDQYDKPILDMLEQPEPAHANRDYLRGLYGVMGR